MIQPPCLKKGDKVAIVSTARKISKSELTYSINVLKNWGLEVVLGASLFLEDGQFAGSDEKRVSDFQTALNDVSVNAIICARGGYGTVRIIDKIDFSEFKISPKWIVGYSDVTVLHAHISTQVEGCSIHATMPINFESNTSQALDSLKKALFSEKIEYNIESNLMNRPGACAGKLLGGNLSILYSLMGSPSGIIQVAVSYF
jgi:muramoyltetrapeptide carboxypeptidase